MRRDEIFERLEPRPGGLQKLRARIEGGRRVRRRVAPLAFAFAAAIALIALVVARRGRSFDVVAAAGRGGDASAVALGLAPLPDAAVSLTEDERSTAALERVKTSDPKVAFYWVSSTSWRGDRPELVE